MYKFMVFSRATGRFVRSFYAWSKDDARAHVNPQHYRVQLDWTAYFNREV
jgi:hypothetical protein